MTRMASAGARQVRKFVTLTLHTKVSWKGVPMISRTDASSSPFELRLARRYRPTVATVEAAEEDEDEDEDEDETKTRTKTRTRTRTKTRRRTRTRTRRTTQLPLLRPLRPN